MFFRGGYFREERDNAKITTIGPPTRRPTTPSGSRSAAACASTLPDESDLQARVFTDVETFHSNFLAVAAPAPRSRRARIGRMTLLQEVPTDRRGRDGAVVEGDLDRGTSSRAGVDWRRVDGASLEQGARRHAPAPTVDAAARLGRHAAQQRRLRAGQVWLQPKLVGHAERAAWTTGRTTTAATSRRPSPPGCRPPTSRTLPDRDDTVFSPRAAALYRVTDKVSAWGSIGSGFRAPTLNELYRQFRVGAVLTLANDQLGPERLIGGELGVSVAPIART